MKPLRIVLESTRPLIVVPETDVKMDGHPILTYNYTIFNDVNNEANGLLNISEKKLEKVGNPNYLGIITFENPGRLFTYTRGEAALESSEIQEIIEQISHIRDNPSLWKSELS